MLTLRLFLLTAATAALAAVAPAYGQERFVDDAPARQPLPQVSPVQRREVIEKLQRRVDCDFDQTGLQEVMAELQRQVGLEISLDKIALEDVGLTLNQPVSLKLPQIRLRTALGLILRELDLTFRIVPQGLVVTTFDEAEDDEASLPQAFYPCDDLMKNGELQELGYDDLACVICYSIEPEAWDELGGPGIIKTVDGGLTISQIDAIQLQVADLLAALRRAKALPSKSYDPQPIELGEKMLDRERVEQAMAVVFPEWKLESTTLAELANLISQRTGVPTKINDNAVFDNNFRRDVKLTGKWPNASAAAVMKDVFAMLNLAVEYRDDVYVITSPEDAESTLKLKVYPVRDFFAAEDQAKAEWRTSIAPFAADYRTLINTVTETIDQQSWVDVGGPGTIESFESADVIVVTQTDEVHQQLEKLLQEIRAGRFSLEQPFPPDEP